jgi:nitrogen fixation/metabolism regulation signal transduction histidine kinase
MKLRTRIISGFLLVAVIPTVLMSLLLHVYIQSSYENLSLKRSQAAVSSFHFFLDDELQKLEQIANQVVEEKDFLVDVLGMPKENQKLVNWLDRQIQNDEFQFALVRSSKSGNVVKAYANDLGELVRGYQYPPPLKQDQLSATGLVQLGGGRKTSVAAVALVPVYHRGELVAELLVGRPLQQMMGGYQTELFGLSGLMVVAGENVVFAQADQQIAQSLVQVATLDVGESVAKVELGNHNYLIRVTPLTGIAGGEVATVRFLFDSAEYSAGESKLFRIFALLLLGAVGFAVVVGLIYSRYLSRPMAEMSAAARKIAAGEIPKRIIYLHDDEIGDLVSGINKLTEDLRRTEQQLRQTEQIAAWQMFARQTAHELRNFLMPLATTAGKLQRLAESGSVQRESAVTVVEDINTEISRMRNLLTAFSEFAKMPPPRMKLVSVKDVLGELGNVFARQLQEGKLHFVVEGKLPMLRCDADQIRQVMLNLLANSYQAGASIVEVKLEAAEDRLWIEVTDDGPGVAPDSDPFAPLYSTKVGGSGLGLAITRRIVVDHGGEISYHPNSTGGAIFKFYLPLPKK